MLYAARLNEPYEARLEAKHRYLKSNYSKTKLARFCYQNESEKEEKPGKAKKQEKKEKIERIEWQDVGDEFKLAFYNIGKSLRKLFEGKGK